jgi:hypothetical protein
MRPFCVVQLTLDRGVRGAVNGAYYLAVQEKTDSAPTWVTIVGLIPPILVAIITVFGSKIDVGQEARKRRRSARAIDPSSFAVRRLQGEHARPIKTVSPARWRLRKTACGIVGLTLALSFLAYFVFFPFLVQDYFLYWEDNALLLSWMIGSLLLEFAAIMTLMRFQGLHKSSAVEARKSERTISVKGDYDTIYSKCRDALNSMTKKVYSVDVSEDQTILENADAYGQSRMTVQIRKASEGFYYVTVSSEMTPSGRSLKKNYSKVIRFIERLTGMKVYAPRNIYIVKDSPKTMGSEKKGESDAIVAMTSVDSQPASIESSTR